MREPCGFCFIKHVCQAEILFEEYASGYDLHVHLGLSHLAEAASEIRSLDPELADQTDAIRRDIESLIPLQLAGEAAAVDVVARFDWQDLVGSARRYIAADQTDDAEPDLEPSDDSDADTP